MYIYIYIKSILLLWLSTPCVVVHLCIHNYILFYIILNYYFFRRQKQLLGSVLQNRSSSIFYKIYRKTSEPGGLQLF